MTTEGQRTPPAIGGTMPMVRIGQAPPNAADETATRLLLEAYTTKDGFRCPKCGEVITDPNKAIDHLKEEINSAIVRHNTLVGQAKPEKK
jgi:hypothetical protein